MKDIIRSAINHWNKYLSYQPRSTQDAEVELLLAAQSLRSVATLIDHTEINTMAALATKPVLNHSGTDQACMDHYKRAYFDHKALAVAMERALYFDLK